jgi:hypothetical protein
MLVNSVKPSIFGPIIFLIVGVLSIALFEISLTPSIQAQGQSGQFTADLSGQNEIPPTASNGTGTAEVLFNNDISHASYFVNITGITEITGAHIHNGSIGVNGDVIVPLSGQKIAQDIKNPTIWFKGEIKKDDLQGSLKGKGISDLVTLINNGSAYVNIHTKDNPNGAIRDQLVPGQVDKTHFSQSVGIQQVGNQTVSNMPMANQTVSNMPMANQTVSNMPMANQN